MTGACSQTAAPPDADRQDTGPALAGLAVTLSVVTGATDVLSFLRLGQVFTSVMTGNLVLLGRGVGTGTVAQIANTAVALGGYLAGTAVGARTARRRRAGDAVWPSSVTVALGAELVIMVGLLAGWQVVGPSPRGWPRLVLLVGAAIAMGIQSAATRQVRVKGLSTTYFTSTLTSIVEEVFLPGRRLQLRAVLQLVGLAVGAGVGALLIVRAARFEPVLPVALLAIVITVALARRRSAVA